MYIYICMYVYIYIYMLHTLNESESPHVVFRHWNDGSLDSGNHPQPGIADFFSETI